ncbi:MAG: hypothetical protein COT24_02035 [Candidatus Kerfeldbacteria bacterium CG08_land_8_20_14_0_20_40_16]|uniref:Uncharacterized protein n=1 Tax=Candidatus Kerfeldbacteria bacterium CG08_land_8_20_14_0_20_40_16 TaxID=2014244 RepID=A0A2H0YW97_9BACT|nr:MAG: hypothetical protein COT24_02035 [Candidatus Kerfeldbacteria bacterium CG08_land_8_20_14_0_20_40_16]
MRITAYLERAATRLGGNHADRLARQVVRKFGWSRHNYLWGMDFTHANATGMRPVLVHGYNGPHEDAIWRATLLLPVELQIEANLV